MSNCLFCRIAQKEVPAKVVYEDATVVGFEDINPKAPVHILIIPKKHIESANTLAAEDEPAMGHLYSVARQLAVTRRIDRSGYRCVLNTGPDAGQSVCHLHLHLMGGRPMAWPPG